MKRANIGMAIVILLAFCYAMVIFIDNIFELVTNPSIINDKIILPVQIGSYRLNPIISVFIHGISSLLLAFSLFDYLNTIKKDANSSASCKCIISIAIAATLMIAAWLSGNIWS